MTFIAAIMAVTVTMSSVASAAPQYKISGAVFTDTETVSVSLLLLLFGGVLKREAVLSAVLPGVSGAKVVISCATMGVNGGKIFKNKEGSEESFSFTGCKVVEPIACKLANSKGVPTTIITTSALTSVVEEAGGLLWIKFAPTSGTVVVAVALVECSAEALYSFSGTIRALVLTNVEEIIKGINFNATSGTSLKFSSFSATIVALAGLTLNGTKKGLVWGVN